MQSFYIGKTLAYLLPIFQFLLQQKAVSYEERKIQALILAPTRELALQVQGECNKLMKGKCGILVGGLATQKQERVLRKNRPPIIIATPGRLWEMVGSEIVSFALFGPRVTRLSYRLDIRLS